MEYPLLSKEGKNLRKIRLNPQVFDGKVNSALLAQAVYCYLNNLHSVKKEGPGFKVRFKC